MIEALKQGLVAYVTVPKRADPFSFRQLCYQRAAAHGITAWTQLCEQDTKVAVWVRPES